MYLVKIQKFKDTVVFRKACYGNWWELAKNHNNSISIFNNWTETIDGWRISLLGKYKDYDLAIKCFTNAQKTNTGKVLLLDSYDKVEKELFPYL
jgi:hypothetical protein